MSSNFSHEAPRGYFFKSNQSLSRVNSLKIGAKVSHNSNPRDRLNSQNYESQLLRLNMASSESDGKIERRWVGDRDDDDQEKESLSDLSSQGEDKCSFNCQCNKAENRDKCDSNLLWIKQKYYKMKQKTKRLRASVKNLESEILAQKSKFEHVIDAKDLQIQKLKEKLEKVTSVSDLLAMPDQKQAIQTQRVSTQKLFENDCMSRVFYLREIQKWNTRPYGLEPLYNPQESLSFMDKSRLSYPNFFESIKKSDEINQSSLLGSESKKRDSIQNDLESNQDHCFSNFDYENPREKEIKEFERALQEIFVPKLQLETTEKDNADISNIKTQKLREIQLSWLKEILTLQYILSQSSFDQELCDEKKNSKEIPEQTIDGEANDDNKPPVDERPLKLNSEQRMVLGGLMKKLVSQIPMARYSQDPAFNDLKRLLKKQGKYLTDDQIYLLENAKKFQFKAHGQNLIDRLTHRDFDKTIFERICFKSVNKASVSNDEIRSIVLSVISEINQYQKEKAKQKLRKTFEFEPDFEFQE